MWLKKVCPAHFKSEVYNSEVEADLSRLMTKPTKCVFPAKTSDQPGHPIECTAKSLRWAHSHFVGFVMRWPICHYSVSAIKICKIWIPIKIAIIQIFHRVKCPKMQKEWQIVLTLIRLFPKEQSDPRLHYLPRPVCCLSQNLGSLQ